MLAFSPELLTCKQFKDLVHKNLGDSWVFVNNIWKKVRKAAQYQLEGIQDFVGHLKYL